MTTNPTARPPGLISTANLTAASRPAPPLALDSATLAAARLPGQPGDRAIPGRIKLACSLAAGAHRDPSRPALTDGEIEARAREDVQDAEIVRARAQHCAHQRDHLFLGKWLRPRVALTDRLSDVLRGLAGRGSEIQNAAMAMQNRPMINPLSGACSLPASARRRGVALGRQSDGAPRAVITAKGTVRRHATSSVRNGWGPSVRRRVSSGPGAITPLTLAATLRVCHCPRMRTLSRSQTVAARVTASFSIVRARRRWSSL